MNCFILSLTIFFLLAAPTWSMPIYDLKNDMRTKVIYGVDNRREVYQVSQQWQSLASSAVTIIRSDHIDTIADNPNVYHVSGPTYGVDQKLCLDEPFFHQKMVAECSAFLVGPDIVATAGHCVRSLQHCQTLAYVFDFQKNSPEKFNYELPKNNFYSCKELIRRKQDPVTKEDFALIRLDRAVTNHKPLALRKRGGPSMGEEMVVIGHPYGVLKKVADQGYVVKNKNRAFFSADLDTYSYNSGSAVFNAQTKKVEGILVRGSDDFSFDADNNCYRSRVCNPGECSGEEVTRITLLNLNLN